jgi:hypothetical protein
MACADVATVKAKPAAAINLIICGLPFQLQRLVMPCLRQHTLDSDQLHGSRAAARMRRAIPAGNNASTSLSLRVAAGHPEAELERAKSQLAKEFLLSDVVTFPKKSAKKSPASRGAFPYIRWGILCFLGLFMCLPVAVPVVLPLMPLAGAAAVAAGPPAFELPPAVVPAVCASANDDIRAKPAAKAITVCFMSLPPR